VSARKPDHGEQQQTSTLAAVPAMSERAWQQVVLELAGMYRWRVHHCRPAAGSGGRWSTPIQGHPGFPDLVLARSGRVLFVELKTDASSSKLTGEQTAWRDVLLAAGAQLVWVWHLEARVEPGRQAQPASAAGSNQTHTEQSSIRGSLTAPLGSTKGSVFGGDANDNEIG